MNLNIENFALNGTGTGDACSKYTAEHDRNTDSSICFRFTGQEIARADVHRFLAIFSPEKMRPTTLRLLRGNLIIQLPPSAARHEEPFLCEKTRRFCHRFYKAFPAWGFFFSLENLSLWKMSLALLDEAHFFQFERAWQTRVFLREQSFAALVARHEEQTQTMASAAGMSLAEGIGLAHAVRAYFGKVASAYGTA